jgi:hypothetical protein
MTQERRLREYLEPLIGVTIVFLLTWIMIAYSVVLINKDALKALIEAEATILGFFGLVIVYMLNSLDTRIDRLEQQRFDWDKEQHDKEASDTKTKRDSVRNLKKYVIKRAAIIGTLLTFSLLISIWLLGIVDIVIEVQVKGIIGNIYALTGGTMVLMFFLSLWFLFSMFKDIAKTS